jgi:purine-binding chemotaxis protein CheW
MDSLDLLVRSRTRICALPLSHVSETLRCLPVQPVPNAPAFVLGVSILRGEPVPVVDLGLLLDLPEAPDLRRLVSLRVGGRRVAIAVEEVLKVVPEATMERHALPPLLRGVAEGSVRSIGVLDHQFLTVLEAARLVPADVWSRLAPAGAPG